MKNIKVPLELWKKIKQVATEQELPIYKIIEKDYKMTYTLNGKVEKEEDEFIFKINETVLNNDSIGDAIGICEDDNILWVSSHCDLYDKQVISFIENLFTSPIETYNTINIIKYK